MKLDRKKVTLVMARNRKDRGDVVRYGVGVQTWANAIKGKDIRPKTAGRIADALGVDVTEILVEE